MSLNITVYNEISSIAVMYLNTIRIQLFAGTNFSELDDMIINLYLLKLCCQMAITNQWTELLQWTMWVCDRLVLANLTDPNQFLNERTHCYSTTWDKMCNNP